MKHALTVLLVSVVMGIAAEPRNELERAATASRRFVLGKEVDIAPLIKWRAKQRGNRPLPAWHYMTGKIVETPPYEWVMEVQIEGEEDTRKIILRHPPEWARSEFYRIKAEHARLLAEANTTAANVNTALESKAEARLNASEIDTPERLRTVKDRQAHETKRQAQKEFGKAAAAADSAVEFESAASRRLRQFDQRGYDLREDFKFFGYALRTGEVARSERLPVFDHGVFLFR